MMSGIWAGDITKISARAALGNILPALKLESRT